MFFVDVGMCKGFWREVSEGIILGGIEVGRK